MDLGNQAMSMKFSNEIIYKKAGMAFTFDVSNLI